MTVITKEGADAVELRKLRTLRPRSEWHEDYGAVLWWHLPIQEPPYVGLDDEAFDARDADGEPTATHRLLAAGWLTHWSPLPQPIISEESGDGMIVA